MAKNVIIRNNENTEIICSEVDTIILPTASGKPAIFRDWDGVTAITTAVSFHKPQIKTVVPSSILTSTSSREPLIKINVPIKISTMIQATVSLPENYTRLLYLESDGKQYIDTGILPTKTTEFEFGAYCYSDHITSGTAHCLMGMRIGQGKPNKEQWRMMVTNYLDTSYSWTGGYVSLGNNQRAQSTEVGITDYVFSYKDGIWSNGNNVTKAIDFSNDIIPTADGELPSSVTLWLFKGNYYGESGDGNPCKDRIKYCKLWQDKKLVRNLVPVLDDKGIPGMFDYVTGETLYNLGTGTFLYAEA